jgi:hypothetical protein
VNPRPYVQIVAVVTLLVATGALALVGAPASPLLAGCLTLGAVVGSWLAIRYRLKRVGHRSRARAAEDRAMAGCLVVGLLIPLGCCWSAVAIGSGNAPFTPPTHGSAAIAISCCLLLIPLSILVSSAVDWYLIRPFREGLDGPPACQRNVSEPKRTRAYARYWILHRGICEFIVYGSLCGIVAFTYSAVLLTASDPVVNGAVSLLGLGGVAWAYTKMRPLAEHAVNYARFPGPGLGSWAVGRNASGATIDGFLVDVSIEPGVQLIEHPVGPPGAPPPPAREPGERAVPLKDRSTLHEIVPPRPLCPGGRCEFWIPDCEVGLLQLECARTPHAGASAARASRA